MTSPQDAEKNTQQSIDMGAQLNALPELGSRLLLGYQQSFSAFFSLLQAKAKANIKMLIAIMALVTSAVFLLCAVWISIQAMIVYGLIHLGLPTLMAAIMVLTLNLFVIYYLLTTAISLFDITYDEFIHGFFTDK
ncbi:hypothetical protein GCM10009111_18680 [Colwellia asteriadis]|uniref:Transmembrane protein n=1 Tax=Colwellia asteriadis TaxID=517723 RepID=A0ABP3WG94_9GAMM